MIRLLDLCCKAGGCSVGYHRAAMDMGMDIEIVGVDIEAQPNYPFKFILGDAVEYLRLNGHEFTHIHASPPCQQFSCSTAFMRKKGKTYPDFVKELRDLMIKSGIPSVIENVPQAGLRPDVVLRGDMFGLKVIRKRHFELVNWFCFNPVPGLLKGTVKNGDYVSVFGSPKWENTDFANKEKKQVIPTWRKRTILETWKFAMQVEWMKREEEVANAIPPPYTEWIGREWFTQYLRNHRERLETIPMVRVAS